MGDRGGQDGPPSQGAEQPPPPDGLELQSDSRQLSGRGGGGVPLHPFPNTHDPASSHEAVTGPETQTEQTTVTQTEQTTETQTEQTTETQTEQTTVTQTEQTTETQTEQTTGDLPATGPPQPPPSPPSRRVSPPSRCVSAPGQHTVLRQKHSGTTQRDDPHPRHRFEAEAKDDCEISRLRCSEFFGSPCEEVSPANVPQYGGHCRISRHAARKHWSACGDVRNGSWSACYCRKNAAVCCANLTSIPDLTTDNSQKVLYLNFTSNHLTVLDQHVLRNVQQVQWLILSRNNFSVVHADALNNVKSLKRFELAYNQFGRSLDPKNLTSAVNSLQCLQVLDVNHTQFTNTTPTQSGITWILRHLRLPNLKQLFVDGGRKHTLYLSDLDPGRLPRLCKFSIKSHFVKHLYCCSTRSSANDSLDYDETVIPDDAEYPYMDGATHQPSCISPESRNDTHCQHFALPKLKLLNLANNSLSYVPHFCRPGFNGSVQSVVPSLTHLLLAINGLINPRRHHFLCLDNLLFLGLTGNPLKTIESHIFQNLSLLQVVDLRFTNVMQVESRAFQHPSLRYVTIKSSNWFMDQRHEACCISPRLFLGSALHFADLSYNVFKFAEDNTTNTFLTPLRTVTTLLMAEVGLAEIPSVVLQTFSYLQVLEFQSNQLSRIRPHTFDNLTSLKYLDLSDNHIAFPREDVLRQLVVGRRVEVNLESNPFSCICDMLAFLDLYKGHRDTRPTQKGGFVGEHYRCYAPSQLYHHDLKNVELTIHNCLLTVSQEILIYVICLLLIFFLLVYILLYKYRWQVRFWMYTLHVRLSRGQGERERGRRPASRPRFKAFVSYCKEDSHFVINEVLPVLERNSRLPLCIHERDFIPGRYISQNVVEFMEESLHVLLILSNAFLQSDWCRFELFVAQRYGLVRRQMPVTVLVLERLRLELLDGPVLGLLQATPGLHWPGTGGDARDRALFWQRLGQTLGSGTVPRAIRAGRPRPRPGQDRGGGGGGGAGGRVGVDRERSDSE